MNLSRDRQVIAAYFSNSDSALQAIDKLREFGFRSNQIGTSYQGYNRQSAESLGSTEFRRTDDNADIHDDDRSFMDKVKGFFSGDEGYEDRDTGVGDGSRNEGMRVGPTLQIPDRYRGRLTGGATIVTVHDDSRVDDAERILRECGGTIDREFTNAGETARTAKVGSDVNANFNDEGQRISLLSEVLSVDKQRVAAGEVRLRKEVRTENQTVEVPVTHEELVIERVPGNESRSVNREIGSDQEMRVPLSEERVNVEKTPVVREEVKVGKRAVSETQKVTDNVRHEELDVDDSTGRVRNKSEVVKDKDKNKRIA